MTPRQAQFPAFLIPLSAVLLAAVTMHVSFFVSLWQGHVPACVPYWIDCISVSRAGRHGTAYFVFKGGMITMAVLLLFTWLLASM